MKLIDQTWELFKKEVVLEWRSKYAFNGVLLYHGLKTRIEAASAREMTTTLAALQLRLHTMPSIQAVSADRETWHNQLYGHQNLDIALFDSRSAPLIRTNGYWPNAEP